MGVDFDSDPPRPRLDDTLAAPRPERAVIAETIDQRPSSLREAMARHPRTPSARDSYPGPASSGSFPVPDWDRYEQLRVLGEGGMGRVFLARDRRLERDVAMKFVRNDDPELARRVVAEARAQARVNDDRVCKVYEVGEVAGRVYIAMQYVDGKPLNELVGELTYEQKALVMRGAALGVHEAHRAGLIHRDLKPSNIMVERGVDGALRPFVMDFGIARDWNESATATGTVLGTPQFMAPEQARGEIKQLDRRADVYGLGATLYALLTGKAPIDGDNPLVVLNRISIDEPPRPRTLDRDLPLDLEAIVMKCLEKDRGQRYDSARALADDLGRFLDGAPVQARASAGLGYRLRKTVRRHWRALAVAVAMLAIVAVAVGYGWRERAVGARRAALAQRFTDRVGRVEALARYAALAPPHDLGRDRARLRTLMDELTAEIRSGGALGEGPGHYALGRGYLALGDVERAQAELETAWAGGFREPRVAYALGITLGRLYERALHGLAALPPAVRDRRRPEIEARYLEPARRYLRASAGSEVPSPGYVPALLAYYDGRYDDALQALDDGAAASPPWFFEVPLLRGQVLQARALAARGSLSGDALAAQLDAARAAFTTATAIGESDPAPHLALADLEYIALGMEIYGRGRVDEPYQRGLAVVDRALALDPADVDALEQRAHLARALAEHRANRGEDATPLLTQAIADARRALALAPQRTDAVVVLASCLRQAGDVRHSAGLDPAEPLGQAIALLESIPATQRDEQSFGQLGLAHKVWADALDEAGGDARDHRQRAIAAYGEVLARNPAYGEVWLNLGINYVERARHAAISDPGGDDDLRAAQAALERGRALRPHSLVPDFYQGEAFALAAERARARGADAEPNRAAAIARYQHGLTVSPDSGLLYNGISIVEAARATDAVARGEAPTAALDRAEAAARAAIAAEPDQPHGYNNLAESFRLRAMALAAQGADPRPMARAATAALAQATARLPDNPDFVRNGARVELVVAAWEAGHGGGGALARAGALIARAQALDPDDAETRELADQLAAATRR
ncbi:MAG: serine/threonine protein kinase [Myxococcales bacterium]|nr:serine/threonine protein kinase [Myxococcales bacterium]